MTSTESIFFWLATLSTALAFGLSAWATVIRKNAVLGLVRIVLIAALLFLTVQGILRWTLTGHPPFVTLFESMTISVWFVLLIYIAIDLFARNRIALTLPVGLASMLLLGWASTLPTDPSPLSATLDNVWLFIHASFATAGAAAFVIASSFSTIYLLGEERMNSLSDLSGKLPEYRALPGTILNFVIFGLILWGVMIVSGSIWAHAAWGRYWAWDPIELWSLISWLLYSLVLHTRIGMKISTRLFCWLTIIAALTVMFALWGVGYLYETIHSYG